jgi:hypothetical protein
MNSAPPTLPGLYALYRRDLIIEAAINACFFGVFASVGMLWASQPVGPPPPVPTGDEAFNAAMSHYVIVGGLVFAALALLVLIWRYLLVRKILSQGSSIKGMVEEIDVRSREIENSTSTPLKRSYTYTYYAIVRYTLNGVERKVRIKLPNSGFTYAIAKGKETDLLVLESKPKKPLIRAVYLDRL